MQKTLGIILILGALGFFLINSPSAQRKLTSLTGSEAERLSIYVEDKITEALATAPELKNWQNIRNVSIIYFGPRAKKILEKHFDPALFNNEGDHKVEIVVLDLKDDKNPGIILQMSLLELKSNNKVGEYGLTVYYNEDF